MIVAPAMKDKDGNIYVGRNAHSELLVLYTEKFRDSEQGFLTSDCRFVDRKEGAIIAFKAGQVSGDDLYIIKDSEGNIDYIHDLFSEDLY